MFIHHTEQHGPYYEVFSRADDTSGRVYCSRCRSELERTRDWEPELHKIEDCLVSLGERIEKLERE